MIAQFQMPGDKIGMQMSQYHVLNFECVLGGEGDILFRVALRVNDGGRACRLISNQIGGVRKARKIELFEDHILDLPR
jgi:hypothetical protein